MDQLILLHCMAQLDLLTLVIHNFFYPVTSYKLIGFIDKDDSFYCVVKQKFIEETEPTDLLAVKKFMLENGFTNTKNEDYYNSNLGIILEDLHEENVLTKDIIHFLRLNL